MSNAGQMNSAGLVTGDTVKSQSSVYQNPNNMGAASKPPGGDATNKVKPCCVCKDEKAKRDECMLFSDSDSPTKACKGLIDSYKQCMAKHGFEPQMLS